MAFITDTFTDTDGVLLSAHTPDSGGSWALNSAYTATGEINTNRARSTAGSATNYYHSAVPPSADYSVTITMEAMGASTTDNGCTGRGSTDAKTYYVVRCDDTEITLRKVVAGTFTLLGTYAGAVVNGDTVALDMAGTTIRALQNGTQRLSVADSAISAVGYAGVFLNEKFNSLPTTFTADSGATAISGSDSPAISISESSGVMAGGSASDSSALAITDSVSDLSAFSTVTDSPAFAVTDVIAALDAFSTVTDSPTISIAEVSALLAILPTATDTPTVSVTESASVVVTTGGSDSPALSITDAVFGLASFSTVTDSPAIGITDLVSGLASFSTTSDSPTISVSDLASLLCIAAAADAPAFSFVESALLAAFLSAGDSPAFSFAEVSAVVKTDMSAWTPVVSPSTTWTPVVSPSTTWTPVVPPNTTWS